MNPIAATDVVEDAVDLLSDGAFELLAAFKDIN